jgi:hypothetical protein
MAGRLHASTAIDAKDLSIDPFSVLRRKEANGARNIERLADTVQGRPGTGILIDLVVAELVAVGDVFAAHCVIHVGLDTARGHTIDGDLLLAGIYFIVSLGLTR